ncbi:MAG: hypothetical protein MK108_11985, partial [Mariniblastus sp.]|nr:hypothetical protein [Mariniblastus sp.]
MNISHRPSTHRRSLTVLLVRFLILGGLVIVADRSVAQELQPVVKPNYAQARQYSSRYLRQFVYDSSVKPNWIGETDEFWYSFRTSQGTRYYRVKPQDASKEPLFDHVKLASLLSEEIRKPLDSANLPISRVEIDDQGKTIKFVVDKLQYEYDLEGEELKKLGKAPASRTRSRSGSREEREDRERDRKEEEQRKEKNVKEKDSEKDS